MTLLPIWALFTVLGCVPAMTASTGVPIPPNANTRLSVGVSNAQVIGSGGLAATYSDGPYDGTFDFTFRVDANTEYGVTGTLGSWSGMTIGGMYRYWLPKQGTLRFGLQQEAGLLWAHTALLGVWELNNGAVYLSPGVYYFDTVTGVRLPVGAHIQIDQTYEMSVEVGTTFNQSAMDNRLTQSVYSGLKIHSVF